MTSNVPSPRPVFICCKKCEHELIAVGNVNFPVNYHLDVICPNCDATIDSIDKIEIYTCTCAEHNTKPLTFKDMCYLNNKELYK